MFSNHFWASLLAWPLLLFFTACQFAESPSEPAGTSASEASELAPTAEGYRYPPVKIIGAMREVMWESKLAPQITFDTLSESSALYGIGPASFLQGELMLLRGQVYRSRVQKDTGQLVELVTKAGAPFFVYAEIKRWEEQPLPQAIQTIPDLERYLDSLSQGRPRPFAFRLEGPILAASYHIQNLPEGSVVRSPEDAHQGQVKYQLIAEEAELLGFFSTEHQGIFTHHDSKVHLHIISASGLAMGHVDELAFGEGELSLFMPVE